MRKRTAAILGIGAVAAGAFALRRVGLREDLEWREVAKPGRVIDIDGYGVHYVDQGAGAAIVLVHGFGGSTYSYRHQIPAFSQDRRVIAVDLKGFGYSERRADAGLSATDQVRMLKRLLDQFGVAHAAFVGHSMGGAVVQRFAAAYPEAVDALVLAGSVRPVARARVWLPAPLVRPFAPAIAALTASRMLTLAFHDRTKLDDAVRDAYLRPLRLRGSLDGLLAMMRDHRHDAPADLSRVRMPVLLLWGADDRLVPLRVAHEIRRDLPQARLTVIEGAGHMLLEEQPGACNRAIDEFLRGATAGQRVPDSALQPSPGS
ncbi:MAG: alpha/beta hydrolase [Chloroflexota bacterium]|nr:alpha/beta hydrolase [Chloroflexota bacterium]